VIIPVLLDEATMPTRQQLPQSLWPLLGRETMRLRADQFEIDIAALIAALEHERPAPPPTPQADPELTSRPSRPKRPTNVPVPDTGHYEDVVDGLVQGSVVVFLGPGANSCDRSERWADAECGFLPDGEELAAYLAGKFGVLPEPAILARVAQYVTVAEGPGDLYRILRTTLAARPEATAVHRFLAAVPRLLQERGLPEQHQLIVTTNYDNALEDAFIEAEEPFDLAVYIASEGEFAHFPYDGEPKQIPIGTANEYKAFPIDQLSGDVSRTVIMKIHGAIDREQEPISWHDNYVITEDDYISYLSDVRAEAVVPSQIKSKLWYSHFLFLGYAMRDWNLRVFLHRMLGKRELSKSWAIQRDPDRFDARFWDRIHVDLYGMPLADYVHELDKHLTP
jgi:SIR2-like domain